MTQGQYIDFYNYDKDKADDLLKSSKTEDKLNGLLTTVLGSNDYEKGEKIIIEFAHADEITLKQNAILCIGHLARIHRRINLEKYIPILESILVNQDEFLIDNAEDALNDIWLFSDKEKIKELKKDTCVARYLRILEISEKSQRDKNYDGGARVIENLKANELNPSVQRIQKTSIEYLNNFV